VVVKSPRPPWAGRSLRSLLAQASRGGLQVLAHQDRPGYVGDADLHLSCVKIDPAVVLVTVPVEAHVSPRP